MLLGALAFLPEIPLASASIMNSTIISLKSVENPVISMKSMALQKSSQFLLILSTLKQIKIGCTTDVFEPKYQLSRLGWIADLLINKD